MQITIGSRVTLHFALRLKDGTVADSNLEEEPLTFVMGDGTLDQGLELALYGLRPGDSQTLTLMPGQAFGSRDPEAVQELDLNTFPADLQPEKGQIIGFTGPQGEAIPGAVVTVGERTATVDFNHPLAGREIEFEVRIVEVENPPEA
jgi:FKBP-type peptidyl-prolyl cis-trans isomerase SlpA